MGCRQPSGQRVVRHPVPALADHPVHDRREHHERRVCEDRHLKGSEKAVEKSRHGSEKTAEGQ